MTTIPSSLYATQSGTQVSDLYTSAAKSLMNQNPALKTIDAQWRRDEARLSNLGKIAQAQQLASRAHMAALADQRSQITETASRQAMLLMQQYSAAGSGGSSLFGMLQGSTMSAFDFMA